MPQNRVNDTITFVTLNTINGVVDVIPITLYVMIFTLNQNVFEINVV